MILKIKNQMIIRLAWGRRRVSSKAAPGTYPYPKSVSADHRLWVKWFIDAWRTRHIERVVIKAHKAETRIKMALGHPATEDEPPLTPSLDLSEVKALQDKREELRSLCKFEEADRIRDYLVEHGVVVADKKQEDINDR